MFISQVKTDLNLTLEPLNVSSWATLSLKKCYHPPSRKKFVTMDIKFIEDQPYYQKTNLQEEKLEVEDQPQDWSLPLPMPTWEDERNGIQGEPKKSEL